MNDLLLLLLKSNPEHLKLGQSILRTLIDARDTLNCKRNFPGTLKHRQSIRFWCSIHILLDFVTEEVAEEYVNIFLRRVENEQVTSSRPYIEWAIARVWSMFEKTRDVMWR